VVPRIPLGVKNPLGFLVLASLGPPPGFPLAVVNPFGGRNGLLPLGLLPGLKLPGAVNVWGSLLPRIPLGVKNPLGFLVLASFGPPPGFPEVPNPLGGRNGSPPLGFLLELPGAENVCGLLFPGIPFGVKSELLGLVLLLGDVKA